MAFKFFLWKSLRIISLLVIFKIEQFLSFFCFSSKILHKIIGKFQDLTKIYKKFNFINLWGKDLLGIISCSFAWSPMPGRLVSSFVGKWWAKKFRSPWNSRCLQVEENSRLFFLAKVLLSGASLARNSAYLIVSHGQGCQSCRLQLPPHSILCISNFMQPSECVRCVCI